MGTDDRNILNGHSGLGIASSLVGGAMLIIQFAVLSAVLLGVKDSQGIIYALSIPFVMYCIGVPVGLVTAIAGLCRAKRNHRYERVGLALTFAGPLVFVLFF